MHRAFVSLLIIMSSVVLPDSQRQFICISGIFGKSKHTKFNWIIFSYKSYVPGRGGLCLSCTVMWWFFCIACRTSGCTDHFAATEEEAYETGRDIVATFNVDEPVEPSDYDEPVLDPAEMTGLIPTSEQYKMDPYQVGLIVKLHRLNARGSS